MKIETIQTNRLKPNPANPRTIRDDKFRKLVQSIREFPKMLEIRPIVVNAQNEVLGGNMRLRACIEAGLTEVPIIRAETLTDDEQRRFIITDNAGFGEWDWEALANEWDAEELADWGVDVPGVFVNPDEMGDTFSLPEGEKPPFQQMTFTFSDAQAEVVKTAIEAAKENEGYAGASTMGNENSNGNAVYLIANQWAEQSR